MRASAFAVPLPDRARTRIGPVIDRLRQAEDVTAATGIATLPA